MKKTKCPNCKSKNLSDGKGDYIYSIPEGREIPIQFCNDCHAEWYLEEGYKQTLKDSKKTFRQADKNYRAIHIKKLRRLR